MTPDQATLVAHIEGALIRGALVWHRTKQLYLAGIAGPDWRISFGSASLTDAIERTQAIIATVDPTAALMMTVAYGGWAPGALDCGVAAA